MPRPQHESQRRLGQWTPSFRIRWQDRAYTDGLTWDEKAMLQQLESFDGVSMCGVVRADTAILAQKHPDKTAEDIESYLRGLTDKGYIKRSGSEIFVVNWFTTQPAMLRGPKNLTSMITAIHRIGYTDLRAEVARTLFAALIEIAAVDKQPTAAAIKELCLGLANQQGYTLPPELLGGTRGRATKPETLLTLDN